MTDPRKRSSPAWKNPREIIKKGVHKSRRKLPLSSSAIFSRAKNDENDEHFPLPSTSSLSQGATSIINNPFQRTSLKRQFKETSSTDQRLESPTVDLILDSNALQEFPSSIFDQINFCSKENVLETKDNVTESMPVDFSSIDEYSCSTPKKKALKIEELKTKVDSLPTDFRLGLKLILESRKPFPWLRNSKEDAAYEDAIRLFCSGPIHTNKESIEGGRESISEISRFLACTLYWQFPDLAWQQSFPRLENESRLIASRDAPVPSLHTLGDPLVHALTMQWFSAFEQLYNTWRSGRLPYFYVCCPAFTILFLKTAKGLIEIDTNAVHSDNGYEFRVIITPTTFGFRQQLRDDGVKYSMPFRHSSRRSSSLRSSSILADGSLLDITQSQPPLLCENRQEQLCTSSDSFLSQKNVDFVLGGDLKENEADKSKRSGEETKSDKDSESSDSLNSSNDTDNDEWLRGIGISPRKTLKITRNMSMVSCHSLDQEHSLLLDPDGSFMVDENKKNAIVLSDPDSIAALHNLMTASNFGRVVTGPQAGFPPTLLSRQPFLHSVLKSLKYKYAEHMKGDAKRYVCELLNGPIMPHMISMLENFLRYSSNFEEGTSIKVQINGRIKCPGMNEAVGLGGVENFDNFEFCHGCLFKS